MPMPTKPPPMPKLPAFEDITRRALNGTSTTVDDFPDDARLAVLEARVRDLEAILDEHDVAIHEAEHRVPAIPAAEAPPTVPVVVHHDSSGMKYNWKWRPETLYAIATACAILALESLADPGSITDWKKWGVALIGACVRATIGILQPRAPEVLTVPMDSLPAGTPVSVDGAARGFTTGAR